MADLDDLRARIDQLDSALIAIVAERLAVCRQVAAVKEGSDTPVIQPARVRDVVDHPPAAGDRGGHRSRLRRAAVPGAAHRDPSHRGRRPPSRRRTGEAGERRARSRSGLDTVATRVDHIVIAVDDLDVATRRLQSTASGSARSPWPAPRGPASARWPPAASPSCWSVPRRRPASPTISNATATGVQHIAIEVLNAGFARAVPRRRRHTAAHRGARRRRRPRAVLRRQRAGRRDPAGLHLPHRPPRRRRRRQRAGPVRRASGPRRREARSRYPRNDRKGRSMRFARCRCSCPASRP